MTNFFKFPSTPHVFLPEEDFRKDKEMSAHELEEFLKHEIVIEEKIDGANLGISFDSDANLLLQNRGSWLSYPLDGQWRKLDGWVKKKQNYLFDILLDKYILFGEWCYAVHSIFYDRLPDYFIGFDLYDKKVGRFLSVDRRNKLFERMDIAAVYQYAKGMYQVQDLASYFSVSHYGENLCEGIYMRWDEDGWLKKRAKYVRYHFKQSIEEHWSKKEWKTNQLIE